MPLPWLEIKRNRPCEVDHDAKHRPIDGRTDNHRAHRLSLGVNRASVDAATLQARLDQFAQPACQSTDVACRHDHRKQRRRTDQEQEWLSIDDDSVDIPITEGGVTADRDRLCRRQQRGEFLCGPKYHHARFLANALRLSRGGSSRELWHTQSPPTAPL